MRVFFRNCSTSMNRTPSVNRTRTGDSRRRAPTLARSDAPRPEHGLRAGAPDVSTRSGQSTTRAAANPPSPHRRQDRHAHGVRGVHGARYSARAPRLRSCCCSAAAPASTSPSARPRRSAGRRRSRRASWRSSCAPRSRPRCRAAAQESGEGRGAGRAGRARRRAALDGARPARAGPERPRDARRASSRRS